MAKSRDISSRNRTRNGSVRADPPVAPNTKSFFSQSLSCTLRNARNIRSSVHVGFRKAAVLENEREEVGARRGPLLLWCAVLELPEVAIRSLVHVRVIQRVVEELFKIYAFAFA